MSRQRMTIALGILSILTTWLSLTMPHELRDIARDSETNYTPPEFSVDPQAQNNPCPTNPYTQVQWRYDPSTGNCIYPKTIAGRGDTGQQTDIVMSLAEANEYANRVGNPQTLFLAPAGLLNNRSLTNMSDEALAALVYAQVFVEEKWFKDYNWVHPYWNSNRDPEGGNWLDPASLNAKRFPPVQFSPVDRWVNSLTERNLPYRLSGFGYGLGNQLIGQTWDSAQWYLEYLNLSENRYGLRPRPLPLTKGSALEALATLMVVRDPWLPSPDVMTLLTAELSSIEQSQFWNVLRFVWAAARHREGAYQDKRSNDEKEKHAIDYNQILGKSPGGRPQGDVSAFALMTTVYSDSITVPEVTGYGQKYTARANRSLEDWKHFVSERNKAIRNVELLGKANIEGHYRIQQPLAIGPLKTFYEVGATADFLPYAREEVENLVGALLFESNNQEDRWVADEALWLLHNAALLQEGYQYYMGKPLKIVRKTINGQEQYVLLI